MTNLLFSVVKARVDVGAERRMSKTKKERRDNGLAVHSGWWK